MLKTGKTNYHNEAIVYSSGLSYLLFGFFSFILIIFISYTDGYIGNIFNIVGYFFFITGFINYLYALKLSLETKLFKKSKMSFFYVTIFPLIYLLIIFLIGYVLNYFISLNGVLVICLIVVNIGLLVFSLVVIKNKLKTKNEKAYKFSGLFVNSIDKNNLTVKTYLNKKNELKKYKVLFGVSEFLFSFSILLISDGAMCYGYYQEAMYLSLFSIGGVFFLASLSLFIWSVYYGKKNKLINNFIFIETTIYLVLSILYFYIVSYSTINLMDPDIYKFFMDTHFFNVYFLFFVIFEGLYQFVVPYKYEYYRKLKIESVKFLEEEKEENEV